MGIGAILRAALALGVIWLAWVLWPVYGFYGHNGDLPLPPFGWLENAPADVSSFSDGYEEAGARAAQSLAAHRERIGAPAMSAAVAVDGKIVWTGVAGWADLETKTPADAHTQFRIGSTSKAVTATALARLVDKGIIDLDEPIGAYWSDLPNPAWATITPRMLASHSAGLPHYGYDGDLDGPYNFIALKRHFTSMREATTLFDEASLLAEPGASFQYSSLGTVLLGAVMSEAAGKPYLDILREEVFAPSGINAIVAPKHAPANSDLATFYVVQDDKFREWRPVDLSHRLPGGGLASTPTDMALMGAKWLYADYIAPETRTAFWTPQALTSGKVNEQEYAIGFRWRDFEVDGVGLARNANHGGVSKGSQSWLLIFPDYNMSIAFMINRRTEEFGTFARSWKDIFRPFAEAIIEQRNGAATNAAETVE